jgi:hypothetical protein
MIPAVLMKQPAFPSGWDEARVRRVLAHYEKQTEVEAVAEDEAAFDLRTHAVVTVPIELVPAVRELLAKHAAKARHSTAVR